MGANTSITLPQHCRSLKKSRCITCSFLVEICEGNVAGGRRSLHGQRQLQDLRSVQIKEASNRYRQSSKGYRKIGGCTNISATCWLAQERSWCLDEYWSHSVDVEVWTEDECDQNNDVEDQVLGEDVDAVQGFSGLEAELEGLVRNFSVSPNTISLEDST